MRRDRPAAHAAMLTVAAVLTVTAALAGCGGGNRPTPAPTAAQGDEGRPIGGEADPSAEAIATSLRFVRGYLALQAGRVKPEEVPDTTPQLREGLRRLRIPPASQSRRAEVAAARLERIDARSARVTVQVRNVDEQLTYPLPIDLVRRDGRWAVLSAGDDT